MNMIFHKNGSFKIEMKDYVKKMVEEFSIKFHGKSWIKTPATDDIFKKGKGDKGDTTKDKKGKGDKDNGDTTKDKKGKGDKDKGKSAPTPAVPTPLGPTPAVTGDPHFVMCK